MQWTQSPPSVADINQDGQNEVIGVSNIEMDPHNNGKYVTQYWALAVYNGDYGNLGATRHTNWTVFPKGSSPVIVNGYYPPLTPPATAIVDILGDSHPEIITTFNDGALYAFDFMSNLLWRYNFKYGLGISFCTEPTIADLNADGSPEIIFGTFGSPNVLNSGNLVILAADGSLLSRTPLNTMGQSNGNGNGCPAAPTVADIDGDGKLEIFLQTFEHGMDVYRVTTSDTSCIPWPTARGTYERRGAVP